MIVCDDWEELTFFSQKELKDILDKDISSRAKSILRKHIKEDIYDAYTPKPNAWVHGSTYQRRFLLPKTVYHEFIRDDEILITSNASASPSVAKGYKFVNRYPGSFLKMLEKGDMGFWRKGFPRPAVSNAQDEINSENFRQFVQDKIDERFI